MGLAFFVLIMFLLFNLFSPRKVLDVHHNRRHRGHHHSGQHHGRRRRRHFIRPSYY